MCEVKHLQFPSVLCTRVSLAALEALCLCLKTKPVQPTEVNSGDVECQEDDMDCSSILAPLFCKSKVVSFRLTCLSLFLIIIANIYSNRVGIMRCFSCLQTSCLRDRYLLENLGFPEEGLKGELGTSLCRYSSFALHVYSPEASLFSPVPPHSVLPGLERLVLAKRFFWCHFLSLQVIQ